MVFDWGTIIGIIGILFGFLSSLFFYLKGKKRKKLAYNTETTILISENLSNYENLRIQYNDEAIKSLSSTNIKIKNIGNDIIETGDFIPAVPIVIKSSDHFLLEDTSKYNIHSSNSKNRVHLKHIDESHIEVSFDFLNPKDEIQITVLHTGEITVTGDLKQGSVKNYSSKKYEKENDNFDKDFDAFYSVFSSKKMLQYIAMLIELFLVMIVLLNTLESDVFGNIKVQPIIMILVSCLIFFTTISTILSNNK